MPLYLSIIEMVHQKPKTKMKRILTFAALILATMVAVAGQPYKAVKGSKITVAGTSTMHDWEMVSEDIQVQASISQSANGLQTVESLKMTLPVNTLKSHKSGMDDNAYKALKAKEYPQIAFTLKNSSSSSSGVEATGQLTIAGTTKDIKTTGKIEKLSTGGLKITGSYKMNMNDFKVEPPSFMFGTVTTGEEVTISYEIILSN